MIDQNQHQEALLNELKTKTLRRIKTDNAITSYKKTMWLKMIILLLGMFASLALAIAAFGLYEIESPDNSYLLVFLAFYFSVPFTFLMSFLIDRYLLKDYLLKLEPDYEKDN